jgi:hypothetical protein
MTKKNLKNQLRKMTSFASTLEKDIASVTIGSRRMKRENVLYCPYCERKTKRRYDGSHRFCYECRNEN